MKTREEVFAERKAQRTQILERLEREHESELAAQIRKCGQPFPFRCVHCGSNIEGETKCKKRWCPVCCGKIAADHNRKIQAAVDRFQWPLFVTLTMRNVDDLSLGAVRRLRRSFGKLRHRKFWKQRVAGGVAAIEITNKGKGWHPHLHAVIDCRFLAVTEKEPPWNASRRTKEAAFTRAAAQVGKVWAKTLKQETASIYIKRANKKTILKEVVKYAIKGNDLAKCLGKIGPLIRAMEGTRLLTTFGTAHGAVAEATKPGRDNEQKKSLNSPKNQRATGGCCDDPCVIPEIVFAKLCRI